MTRRSSKPPSPSPWVGRRAPAFTLPDQTGAPRRLAEFRGRWLVLFFYPKDGSAGCAAQAAGFRDLAAEFAALPEPVAIVGVSTLDAASKAAFAAAHALPFLLLADEAHRVAERYGVWVEKSMYGHRYMGIARETFVVGPGGKVAAHWPKAKASPSHAAEVLAALRELMREP